MVGATAISAHIADFSCINVLASGKESSIISTVAASPAKGYTRSATRLTYFTCEYLPKAQLSAVRRATEALIPDTAAASSGANPAKVPE